MTDFETQSIASLVLYQGKIILLKHQVKFTHSPMNIFRCIPYSDVKKNESHPFSNVPY